MGTHKTLFLPVLFLCLAGACPGLAQELDFTAVRAEVDFSRKLRDWDGFGFNYVEVPQTLDYSADPQEYGGFSLLKEEERQKILDMVFDAFRTCDENDRYASVGRLELSGDILALDAPARSATTLFSR